MKTQYATSVNYVDVKDCWRVSCTRTFHRTVDYYRPFERAVHIHESEAAWVSPHKIRQTRRPYWRLNRLPLQQPLSEEFTRLSESWKAETGHFSTVFHKVNNINYLRIIGLGYKAVPLILRDLESAPGHWHVALNAITKQNPVPKEQMRNLNAVQEAWVAWGRKRNLI